MKIAVLISGQPRGFAKITWSTFIKNVIEISKDCSFDVFLSVEDTEKYEISGIVKDRVLTDSVIEEYKQVYLPYLKDIKVNTWKVGSQKPSYLKAISNNEQRKDRLKRFVHYPWLKQFMWLQEAWEMMERYENIGKFKYDIVIKVRPDVSINDPISISSLDLNNYVYTCIDWFIVGLYDDMKWICSEFLNHWFTYRSAELLFNDEDTKYKWVFSAEIQISSHIRAKKNEKSLVNHVDSSKSFSLHRFSPQKAIIIRKGGYANGPFWSIKPEDTHRICKEKQEDWLKMYK